MYRPPTIWRHLLYYAFLCVCIAGFALTCCTFFFYRLLLKPLFFLLVFLATLPLIGKELLKKEGPRQRIEQEVKRPDHSLT